MKQLILGGARSGKSSLAEQLAQASGKKLVYIATADSRQNDDEMEKRIMRHREGRSDQWLTIETPLLLSKTLAEFTDEDHFIVVDCLTLWLTNCLLDTDKELWPQQKQQLLLQLKDFRGDLIMIGNEVGNGIIPLGEINRQFVDENGFLHQALAALCDRVILTAAGLPLVLKGEPLTGETE